MGGVEPTPSPTPPASLPAAGLKDLSPHSMSLVLICTFHGLLTIPSGLNSSWPVALAGIAFKMVCRSSTSFFAFTASTSCLAISAPGMSPVRQKLLELVAASQPCSATFTSCLKIYMSLKHFSPSVLGGHWRFKVISVTTDLRFLVQEPLVTHYQGYYQVCFHTFLRSTNEGLHFIHAQ